jgi:ABC-type glycerol-3-phosphate transport system permease component
MTNLQSDVRLTNPQPTAAVEPARVQSTGHGHFSISKPFIYLLLCAYFLIVVYPMVWLFYTSLKPDQEIFLHPFSLPNPRHLQWDNYENAWVKGSFGRYSSTAS